MHSKENWIATLEISGNKFPTFVPFIRQ